MDFSREEYERIAAGQLRRFDDDVAEFRRFYESLSLEKQVEAKRWLEKATALYRESTHVSAGSR